MATARTRRPRGKMGTVVPRSESGAKGGSPSYVPTEEQKEEVTIAAACGMSHEDIAIGLQMSRASLEKHFAYELSHGAYKRRIAWFDALNKQAMKGHVAAAKALLQRTPVLAVPPASEDKPAAEKPAPAVKKGKKEQAQDDARAAVRGGGGGWGALLAPQTVQ